MTAEQKREPFNLHRWAIKTAETVSLRSSCDRKHVGAALLDKEGELYSTGYNGAPSGAPECWEKGHIMYEGHCVRVVHAEVNAILNAAMGGNGRRIVGSTMYITASPCHVCLLICKNVGIKRIIYGEPYRDQILEDLARESGMEAVYINNLKD